MRPASSSWLVVPALALVLAACGGDGDGGAADSGVQEGEARDVVLRYFRAVVAGNSEEACAMYLTDAGVRDIYGQDSCKGVTDFVSGPVRVESVETSGDTASVVVFLSAGTGDGRGSSQSARRAERRRSTRSSGARPRRSVRRAPARRSEPCYAPAAAVSGRPIARSPSTSKYVLSLAPAVAGSR